MVSELIYCCDDALTLGRPVLKVDFSYHSIPGEAQDASIRISCSVFNCHEDPARCQPESTNDTGLTDLSTVALSEVSIRAC